MGSATAVCRGASRLPSCCAGALSCLTLLCVYGVREGGSRTGTSSKLGLCLPSKMHLGNGVHGRFECGLVGLRAGGTSRQPLSEPRRVSKLRFTAPQHAWSHESSLQRVSIRPGAAHPPALQALTCRACAFVRVRTPACVLVPPLALVCVRMSCRRRGAVLCRYPCGGAKASLQLSKAWVQPLGSPGCLERWALICPRDLAGSGWEAPACCRLNPSLPWRGKACLENRGASRSEFAVAVAHLPTLWVLGRVLVTKQLQKSPAT